MKNFRTFFHRDSAQTAVELTIFGGVLMFVLAIIVRQAFNVNFQQNLQLKAMRMAMARSFQTSERRSPAHNIATILVVEDRLSPSSGKYGPVSRTPFVMSGSGTMSAQLFMPQDYGILSELPRVDMFVNGQHFQFTTAGYKEVAELTQGTPTGWTTQHPDYDPACAFRYIWDPISAGYNTYQEIPCRRFHRVVPNFVAAERNKFCCEDMSSGVCVHLNCQGTRCCNTDENLSADERYDLDRDPATGIGGAEVVGTTLRSRFAWQWFLLKGFDPERSAPAPVPGPSGGEIVPYRINYGDGIYFTEGEREHKENIVFDVDRDLKEEFVLAVEMAPGGTGVYEKFLVLDQQEGDLDLSFQPGPGESQQGLLDEMRMYSYTKDGTYLQLDEGEMFSAGRFVRSIQKRNRVDVVERAIQLNRDTGRFCDSSGARINPIDPGTPLEHENPVEVCNNCFNSVRVHQTCYEQATNIIYVRSRIEEKGGRKWVTPID